MALDARLNLNVISASSHRLRPRLPRPFPTPTLMWLAPLHPAGAGQHLHSLHSEQLPSLRLLCSPHATMINEEGANTKSTPRQYEGTCVRSTQIPWLGTALVTCSTNLFSYLPKKTAEKGPHHVLLFSSHRYRPNFALIAMNSQLSILPGSAVGALIRLSAVFSTSRFLAVSKIHTVDDTYPTISTRSMTVCMFEYSGDSPSDGIDSTAAEDYKLPKFLES